MIRRAPVPSLVALALAGAAGIGLILAPGNPLRSLFVLSFVVVGPGLAFVPLLRIDGLPGLTLAVGLSLALDALLSTIMIYANAWSPPTTLALLILLSLLGVFAQLTTAFRPSRIATEERS